MDSSAISSADRAERSDRTGSSTEGARQEPAVAVRNLVKEYGSGEDAVRAVDGVSFDVQSGTAVGVLGPNGAGKTTMIKSMLSLIVPSEGDVRMAGLDVAENPRAVYRRVGAMLEGTRNVYWRLTVRENMRFFARLSDRGARDQGERHRTLLEQFGLADRADTTVRELSRGQKQKVALCCALARDGDVLFLDEPTLGLDVESSLELRSELRDLVEESGSTVLLTSHDMDVVQSVCDRVVILNDGEIVADDSVEALLEDFSAQAYEVTVDAGTPDAVRSRIGSATDDGIVLDDVEPLEGGCRLSLRTTDGDFHDAAEALSTADLSVRSFDTVEPDLEDVFLHITDTGGAAGDDRLALAGGDADA